MASLDERLTQLEIEVDELRSHIDGGVAREGWIDQITGSFKDDPDFDEVLRLGRELRESDRVCPE
jgi:hypothetical protein